MIRHSHLPFSIRAAVCLSTLVTLSPAASVRAQQGTAALETQATASPAADPFSFEVGHAAKGGAVYSVEATQPTTSKLTGQKVQLTIVEKSSANTATRYYTLATGKYKTVAQLHAVLEGVFRRFLASPAPAPGQEIGKIGDLKHGGEVRFIVGSANVLRFENLSPNEPVRTNDYSRADIEGLLSALTL